MMVVQQSRSFTSFAVLKRDNECIIMLTHAIEEATWLSSSNLGLKNLAEFNTPIRNCTLQFIIDQIHGPALL